MNPKIKKIMKPEITITLTNNEAKDLYIALTFAEDTNNLNNTHGVRTGVDQDRISALATELRKQIDELTEF